MINTINHGGWYDFFRRVAGPHILGILCAVASLLGSNYASFAIGSLWVIYLASFAFSTPLNRSAYISGLLVVLAASQPFVPPIGKLIFLWLISLFLFIAPIYFSLRVLKREKRSAITLAFLLSFMLSVGVLPIWETITGVFAPPDYVRAIYYIRYALGALWLTFLLGSVLTDTKEPFPEPRMEGFRVLPEALVNVFKWAWKWIRSFTVNFLKEFKKQSTEIVREFRPLLFPLFLAGYGGLLAWMTKPIAVAFVNALATMPEKIFLGPFQCLTLSLIPVIARLTLAVVAWHADPDNRQNQRLQGQELEISRAIIWVWGVQMGLAGISVFQIGLVFPGNSGAFIISTGYIGIIWLAAVLTIRDLPIDEKTKSTGQSPNVNMNNDAEVPSGKSTWDAIA